MGDFLRFTAGSGSVLRAGDTIRIGIDGVDYDFVCVNKQAEVSTDFEIPLENPTTSNLSVLNFMQITLNNIIGEQLFSGNNSTSWSLSSRYLADITKFEFNTFDPWTVVIEEQGISDALGNGAFVEQRQELIIVRDESTDLNGSITLTINGQDYTFFWREDVAQFGDGIGINLVAPNNTINANRFIVEGLKTMIPNLPINAFREGNYNTNFRGRDSVFVDPDLGFVIENISSEGNPPVVLRLVTDGQVVETGGGNDGGFDTGDGGNNGGGNNGGGDVGNVVNLGTEVDPFYPVHNDLFVAYNYGLEDFQAITGTTIRGDISVRDESGVELFDFSISPNDEEIFIYNLKEVVKTLYFNKKFADLSEVLAVENFVSRVDGVLKNVNVVFKIVRVNQDGSSTQLAQTDRTYLFKNSVIQIGESIFKNPYALMHNTKDGNIFRQTYFEGFPFFLDLQFDEGNKLRVKHKGTQDLSEEFGGFSNSVRMVIDKGDGDNWINGGFLHLKNDLNNLAIVNSLTEEEVVELKIKKRQPNKGVYLKFWNGDGSYNFWLFDKFYKDDIRARSLGSVANNLRVNVPNFINSKIEIGKRAERDLILKTKCDDYELEQIKSLFISPKVQMYTSQEAHKRGEFVDVSLNESYSFYTKKNIHNFEITIELPEIITATI